MYLPLADGVQFGELFIFTIRLVVVLEGSCMFYNCGMTLLP